MNSSENDEFTKRKYESRVESLSKALQIPQHTTNDRKKIFKLLMIRVIIRKSFNQSLDHVTSFT